MENGIQKRNLENFKLVLRHMLIYNPNYRPDFLELYQIIKSLKLAEWDDDINLWKE